MLNFAMEVSAIARDIGRTDHMAVKIASAEDSARIQNVVAVTSDALYTVMMKRASEDFPGNTSYQSMLDCVIKVAECLKRPSLTYSQYTKLAAAVATDDAINMVLTAETNDTERAKLAALRSYGREYFVGLLREVI